jgi:hypothetical protein
MSTLFSVGGDQSSASPVDSTNTSYISFSSPALSASSRILSENGYENTTSFGSAFKSQHLKSCCQPRSLALVNSKRRQSPSAGGILPTFFPALGKMIETRVLHFGVVDRIKDLGLRPHMVHEVCEVADKEKCPHIDTIVVDSLTVVWFFSVSAPCELCF